MKRYTLLASCAVVVLGAGSAWADCAEELAMLTGETEGATAAAGGEEIVKDGSLAPLQADGSGEDPIDDTASTGATVTDAGSTDEDADGAGTLAEGEGSGAEGPGAGAAEEDEQVVKDGSVAPLEEAADGEAGVPEAGGGTPIATSGQDAQAQQTGEETAAVEAAAGGDASGDRQAAIERARTALAAGDEEACMQAVREAQS